MKLTDLVIDSAKTVGKNFLLVAVQPVYQYSGGVKSDLIEGYRYTVVLKDKAYEQLAVKIMGAQRLDEPVGADYPSVLFDKLELYVYWTPTGYQVGARAEGISIKATDNSGNINGKHINV